MVRTGIEKLTGSTVSAVFILYHLRLHVWQHGYLIGPPLGLWWDTDRRVACNSPAWCALNVHWTLSECTEARGKLYFLLTVPPWGFPFLLTRKNVAISLWLWNGIWNGLLQLSAWFPGSVPSTRKICQSTYRTDASLSSSCLLREFFRAQIIINMINDK